MRTYIGWLVLLGIALMFSGCAERRYNRGNYYGPYGYSHADRHDRRHDDRRHDDDRRDYRHDRDDRR